MGIHNTHMYEKAIVAMAKQSVTLEVLSYHASASMDDAGRLKVNVTRMLLASNRQGFEFTVVSVLEAENSIVCLLSIA